MSSSALDWPAVTALWCALILGPLLSGCKVLDGGLYEELRRLNERVCILNERVGTSDGSGLTAELSGVSTKLICLDQALGGSQGLIARLDDLSGKVIRLGGDVARLQTQVLVLRTRLGDLSKFIAPDALINDLGGLAKAVTNLKQVLDGADGLSSTLGGRDGLGQGLRDTSNALVRVQDRLCEVVQDLAWLEDALEPLAGRGAAPSVLDDLHGDLKKVGGSLRGLNRQIGRSGSKVGGLWASIGELMTQMEQLSKAIGAPPSEKPGSGGQ